MKKTILVTGGAGVIGSNVANTLANDSANYVIVLDNLSSGHLENLQLRENLHFIQGNVFFDEDLERTLGRGVDIVFHLAANFANQNSVDFPQRDLQVNGMGTLKMLLYSARYKVKRFVYSSSSCVYGNRDEPLSEQCREFSLDTPYAITKLLGERYVDFFHLHHKLDTVILRYFNTYGPPEYPGHYRSVIGNFFYRAMRNEDITITGTGEETRDFNFVEDTVRATIIAGEHPDVVGEVFNIASGRETRVIDVVKMILKITNSRSKIVHVPRRSWDTIARRVADTTHAKRILKYKPEIAMEDGLKRYYDWMKVQDFKKCEW